MNEYIVALAHELANRISEIIDLPFFSEEEEQVFFELVLTKALEIILEQVSDCFPDEEETEEAED